jgi:hypothetical protein
MTTTGGSGFLGVVGAVESVSGEGHEPGGVASEVSPSPPACAWWLEKRRSAIATSAERRLLQRRGGDEREPSVAVMAEASRLT